MSEIKTKYSKTYSENFDSIFRRPKELKSIKCRACNGTGKLNGKSCRECLNGYTTYVWPAITINVADIKRGKYRL